MTYDYYRDYSHWNRPQTDADRAEQLAEARRRANANLVANQARRANLINHKAWQ